MISKILIVVTAILFSGILAAEIPKEAKFATVKIVDNIEQFKLDNPDLELIPLQRQESRQIIRYTLGSRINGDRLVAQGTDNKNFGTPQNVQLTLQYPVSGTGSIVTFVDVLVEQSSTVGNGYVASGGIGQRYIVIAIEAYSTTYFKYAAQIFGV